MFSSIVSAVASGLKIIATAMGWLKQNSDQNIGRQLQAADDMKATIKDATDAQHIDATVSTESRDALIDQLRGPSAS